MGPVGPERNWKMYREDPLDIGADPDDICADDDDYLCNNPRCRWSAAGIGTWTCPSCEAYIAGLDADPSPDLDLPF